MQSRWFGKAATACAFPLLVVAALHDRRTVMVAVLAVLTAALLVAAAGDYLHQFVRELRLRRGQRLTPAGLP